MEFCIIYAISFIFRFLVCIYFPSHFFMLSLFFSQHNGFFAPSSSLTYLFSFLVSSLPMSMTTCSDRWLHQNYFSEQLYYRHISSLFSPITMASFHCHHCWLLYLEVFYDSSSSMTASAYWYGLLHLKLLLWAIQSSPYIMIGFSHHNGVVSPSPLLTIIFWSLSTIHPHRWVHLLIWIAASIGNTFLINFIVSIYHHFFSPSTMMTFHCHHCSFLYFEFFYYSYFLLIETTLWYGWLH